jgi:predicted RNase H-like nuclease (RuvC/YqgF family)
MEAERGVEGTQAEEAREAEVKMTEDMAEALAAAEEQAYELEGLLDRSEAKVKQLEREMVAVQSRLYTDLRTKEDDLAAATKQVAKFTKHYYDRYPHSHPDSQIKGTLHNPELIIVKNC